MYFSHSLSCEAVPKSLFRAFVGKALACSTENHNVPRQWFLTKALLQQTSHSAVGWLLGELFGVAGTNVVA